MAQLLNRGAEVTGRDMALSATISAAQGLREVLKTNLGPKGTIKMLVDGAGAIKLTKDGGVLLNEMQFQNPTASLIARTATAQDDMCGDGTTSTVLIIGELLKQAVRYISEGLHPRVVTDGFDFARDELTKWMETQKLQKSIDRELLVDISRLSLATKVKPAIANQLAEMLTDAVRTVQREGQQIDLHMVEIMTMQHKKDDESVLVRGLVMDHGARHPDMPRDLKNAYVLTCNVSLEYEKSEVNAGFYYGSAEQREGLVKAERAMVNDRVQKVIDLKKKVCAGTDKTFVVINQKGIDPESLDMLARENILGLRRAKRRNMERLTLACGGIPVNSVDDLTEDVLGFAGHVHEEVLGEDKFTFVEETKNPMSCTILIKGASRHSIIQIKDAVRDGLRAVKNTIEDGCVLPGGGAFEMAAKRHLYSIADKAMIGKAKLGVIAFADALLCIPKTLAENSGFDVMDSLIKLEEEHIKGNTTMGLDVNTGNAIDSSAMGIYDGFHVKKQMLGLASVISTQLLLVDEVLRAGKDVNK